MQFSVFINQSRAVEWGLNCQQAILFSFVYELHSWAQPVEVDGVVYYRLSKSKVLNELPMLTDKVDTVYRLLKQLEGIGLVQLGRANGLMAVAVTTKGHLWNRERGDERWSELSHDLPLPVDNPVHNHVDNFSISEKNPSQLGKKSEPTRKKIRHINIPVSNNQIRLPVGEAEPVNNFRQTEPVPSMADPPCPEPPRHKPVNHAPSCRSRFEIFCKAYPKDCGQRAWDVFQAIDPDDPTLDRMLMVIAAQRMGLDWRREQGRFVPRPERWLRERRWVRPTGAMGNQFVKPSGGNGSEKNPAGFRRPA